MTSRSRRRRPRRSSPFVPIIAIALSAAALVVVLTRTGGDDEAAPTSTSTSTTTTSSPPATTSTSAAPPDPVPVDTVASPPFEETPPATYRITYEVVENQLARTETITVRRPYESLVVSRRDGDIVGGTATSRARLWTHLTDRDGWLVVQPELHRAAFDHRPLPALAAVVALGRAEETGTDRYLDRDCRVFRTGQPLGNVGTSAPTAAESSELCVDDAGLVLHERWEIDGTVVTERTATALEVDPEVDPAAFDPTPVAEDTEGFEAVLSTVAVPADEETMAQLQVDISPPPGYALDGTVLRAGSPDQAGAATTEIVRFYSDGVDLIELAEITSTAPVTLDHGNAVPLDIDGPETWFFPDLRASAIRTRLSATSFAELRGTNPAQLVALLNTMTTRAG